MHSIFYLSVVLFINGLSALKAVPHYQVQKCRPVNILFIWHVTDGDTFVQQTRFIMHLLRQLPDNSGIYITTTDPSFNMLQLKKNSSYSNWADPIGSIKPSDFENHIIPFSVVSKSVYSFMDKIGKQEIAEVICFVVNKKSRMSPEEIAVNNILQYKLTYIIFTGDAGVSTEMWANLSSDKRHLFILEDNITVKVDPLADAVTSLCCQDSHLICDTDEYWTERRCYKCTFICSMGTQKQSALCQQNCPYFHKHFPARTNCTVDHKEKNDNIITKGYLLKSFFFVMGVSAVVIIFIYGAYQLLKKYRNRRYKSTYGPIVYQRIDGQEENTHSTFEDVSSTVRNRNLGSSPNAPDADQHSDSELRSFFTY